jgi:hypothetical protein
MRDRILLSLTQVTDDETGICQVGELDFGISGNLGDYLRNDPDGKKRDEALAMMGYLMHEIWSRWCEANVASREVARLQEKREANP